MKKIKKVKNGFFERNLSLAKLAFKTGRTLMKSTETLLKDQISETVATHSENILHEFSMMKGSVLKLGQTLSMFLGDYLPPQIKTMLSSMEQNTYFLEWETIKKQIPVKWFEELTIEEEPFAAASIGQVHLATHKKTKEKYAVKIQYPGVKKAIDRDIFTLKLLIASTKIIPKNINLDPIYKEVKFMMEQEMDYKKELTHHDFFSEALAQTDLAKVIEPIHEFCNDRVLTTRYTKGYSARSEEIQNLSQEKRNELGEKFLHILYHEIFIWNRMQTDGHLGNYLVELKPKPKWILLDFGATKVIKGKLLKQYKNLVKSCYTQNRELFFKTFETLGEFENFHTLDKDLYWGYIEIMNEPFVHDSYDFGKSDISERALAYLPKLFQGVPEGSMPAETLFIDRKIANVFFVLKTLRCNINVKKIIDEYI